MIDDGKTEHQDDALTSEHVGMCFFDGSGNVQPEKILLPALTLRNRS